MEVHVDRLDFDDSYFILQEYARHTQHVYFPNGKFIRKIECPACYDGAAYQNGKLIIGHKDQILRVWDLENGTCLRELRGHTSKIVSVQGQKKNIVISGDESGLLIVWDLSEIWGRKLHALQPRMTSLTSTSGTVPPSTKIVMARNGDEKYNWFFCGPNFVIGRTAWGIRVTEFAPK